MKTFILTCLVFAGLTAAIPLRSQISPAALDADLESIRGRNGVPGVLAMVVRDGQILAHGAAGVRRQGQPTAIAIDDPVNIGSCTKWMTATVAGRLVDRGIIHWSTRIRDVFPNFSDFNSAYRDVTLEDLLAHRGGVPEDPVWQQRFLGMLDRQTGAIVQIRRWVANVTLADRPQVQRGTELYSNHGYTLAAVMLELRTGKSWETMMAEELFVPLGMTSARIGITYETVTTPPAAVVGHDFRNGGLVPLAARSPSELLRIQAMIGPAGMVVCTLRDLARFLHMQTNGAEGYLTPETLAKLRTPYAGETGYALGVRVLGSRSWSQPGPALNHNGDIFGETSSFVFAPGRNLIAVAFTNAIANLSNSLPAVDSAIALMLSRYATAEAIGPYLDGTVPTAPVVTNAPASMTASVGQSVTFSVAANGPGTLRYQWRFNDMAIPGATQDHLRIEGLEPRHAGYYSVDVRNLVGVTASAAATLSLASPGAASRLSNLSVLTVLAPEQVLTAGFNLGGGAKPLLLRACGPGLGALGVGEPMPNPQLAVHSTAGLVASNDDWSAGAAIYAAMAAAGAFPVAIGSPDAALLLTLEGLHSVRVSGSPAAERATNHGAVILEVYDAGDGDSQRLTNLSVLHTVGGASGVLTAGFTIAGVAPRNLLIRAVGPGLAGFGVDAPLPDPRLDLFGAGGVRIGGNASWPAELAGVFGTAGAFSLPLGSRDAAVSVRFTPGAYTVQVSSAGQSNGPVLLEIYELP
jgi:CubicO group peptidase (beta-lactamase class C family)